MPISSGMCPKNSSQYHSTVTTVSLFNLCELFASMLPAGIMYFPVATFTKFPFEKCVKQDLTKNVKYC